MISSSVIAQGTPFETFILGKTNYNFLSLREREGVREDL